MIDMVAISVPFLRKFVTDSPAGESFIDDRTLLEQFGVDLTGQISFDNGKAVFSRLRHNFESLPSSFASLAFKIVNGTDFRQYPYLKIVGNPAKLLQGHNVYGSDNLELCIMAVVEAFCFGDHGLHQFLDWEHSMLDYMDITYTAHVENNAQARQVLAVMRQIKVGQTRPCPDEKYDTTLYFNKSSEYVVKKIYLKGLELDHQIKLLTRKFTTTKLDHYKRQLLEITRPEIRLHAQGAIRFEARVYRRWLDAKQVPSAVGLLTDPNYQATNFGLIPRLWRSAFQDIFKSFEGATMNTYDTDKVYNQLKLTFAGRLLKSGEFSYTKANKLFGLFEAIQAKGYERTKSLYPRNTWMRHMNDLRQAGLSLAQLMNLNGDSSNVVPFIRMINVDFSRQLPADFVEPIPLSQQYKNQPALLRLVS